MTQPNVIEIKRGESLCSLLLRFREENGLPSLYRVLQLADVKLETHKHLWRLGDHYEALSYLLGLSRFEILDMGFQRTTLGLGKFRAKSTEGWSLPASLIDTSVCRVCPDCLKHDPQWASRAWDLPFITCCPIHKTKLIDTCPICDRHLTWGRRHVGCCKCGFDLSSVKAEQANDYVLSFTEKMYESLRWDVYSWPFSFPSAEMDIEQLLMLAWALFRIARPWEKHRKAFHQRRSLAQWEVICGTAGKLLWSWPDSLKQICEASRQDDSKFDRTPPSIQLGFPYRVMNKLPEGEAKEFLRSELNELYPMQPLTEYRGQELLDKLKARGAKTVCAEEARRILEIGKKKLLNLTDSGDLPQTWVPGKKLRRWKIEVVEAYLLKTSPAH